MSTIRVDNFAPSAGGAEFGIEGIAKAFAKVSAISTILGSENISSVTDVATGEDDLTFTNNFGSSDYSLTGAANDENNTRSWMFRSEATSGFTARVRTSSNSLNDTVYSFCSTGDLA